MPRRWATVLFALPVVAGAVAAAVFAVRSPDAEATNVHGVSIDDMATGQGGGMSDEDFAPPADPDQIERGRELFLTDCVSCHGSEGEGTDQGPDLRGVGAASADFFLSTGRMPNTEPDRQALSKRSPYNQDEIDDLVAYVASLAPGPPIPDVDNPAGDLQEGGVLYRLNCQPCHSAAGDGGALSSGRVAPELHSATSVQAAEAMRIGPGPMPVFDEDTFTDEQVNSIVRYVEYLRDPDDEGGLSLGIIGPITEGLVAIVVGLGLLVLAVRWIESQERRGTRGQS
ncbi:MAG: cytochrome bc1 complex diheme cytochrome c subunit [Acidimicrobiia bacterium]